MSLDLIHVGLSDAFHNKQIQPGYDKRAFGNSFEPTVPTLESFVQHVLTGKAWTPGYFAGKSRKNETFQFAELIPLDMDHGVSVQQALENPLIQRGAILIHPSPSSTPDLFKTRVIIRLDQRIENGEAWRALVFALCRESGLDIDPASYKPAQLYYGSTNRVEQPYINYDAMLPIASITPLLIERATVEMLEYFAPKAPPIPIGSDKGGQIAERILARLAAQTNGYRHDAIITAARKLAGLEENGAISSDWCIDLRRVAENILPTERHEEIGRAIQWGADHPIEMVYRPKPAQKRPKPSQNGTVSTQNHAGIKRKSAEIAPAGDPVVTWGDYRFVNLYDPYLAMIAAAMGDSTFTAADYAARIGKSIDTAQRQLDHALEWGDVSEVEPRSAKISSRSVVNVMEKNAERLTGAAVARRYRLTIDFDRIWERLPDRLIEIGEFAETDVIPIRKLREAGEAQLTAKSLNVITREAYFSEAGERLNQGAIQRAEATRLKIWRECRTDDQPASFFTAPSSPTELRAALLRHAFEKIPTDQPILQRDLVWIAGVKRRNVGNIIKEAGLVPAENPTFVDVGIDDKRHGYKGAKVAYLDERHEIICGAAEKQPKKAAFVRLNIGKTYAPAPAAIEKSDPPSERQPKTPSTPAQTARRDFRRQQRELRRIIEGTLRALGWKLPNVPFAEWQRGDLRYPNTWAGMIDALLENDLEWANEQRKKRLLKQRRERRKFKSFVNLERVAA